MTAPSKSKSRQPDWQPQPPTARARRPHEAVLAAALDPEHKVPDQVNLRTKHSLCSRGLAMVRPYDDASPFYEFHLTAAGRAYAERHGTPTPRRRVVIISCGSRKRDDLRAGERVPAGELYIGSYHKALRRAADALTIERGTILIASALYGLVPLKRRVRPYNVRLTDPDAVTAARVRGQALHLGLDDADVLFLGGRPYGALIQRALPNSVAPLGGHGGMGHQLHILKTWASPEAEGERHRCHLWHEAAQQVGPADEVAFRSTPTE